MIGLSLTALFGVVSYLLGYGIFVPEQLKVFNFIAAASAMAGYSLGNLVGQKAKNVWLQAGLIIVALAVCTGSTLAYLIFSQQGAANVSDIVFLGALLATMFVSFWFLLPIAGVVANIGK
jgi:hypothetical protein